MNDEQHKSFAIDFNKRFWHFFTKGNLSEAEKREMLNAAYSSLTHWKAFSGGTIVHEQRGEYLVAKAWLHLKDAANALRYADLCLEKTETNNQLMKDFDVAFAHEIKFKAERLAGNTNEADKFYKLATEKGNAIVDKGDRDLFFDDLAAEI